jgi:hypothetical protein
MARVQVKKMALDVDQEALTGLFEQMTGARDADIDVIIPKYVRVMTLLKKLYKLYDLCITIFKVRFESYIWSDEIREFLDTIVNETNLDVEHEYTESDIRMFILSKYGDITNPEATIHINKLYKAVKDSNIIKTIMVISANLAPFKQHLEAKELTDGFIYREPGTTFTPFPFTSLDLKFLWDMDLSADEKRMMLNIIKHSFEITYEIYDIIYSPDVDIDNFSELLISTISKLRGQVPRCDKAFDIIENSVKLLRTNFTQYFRSSVESENPSTILESFVIDVAKTQKANPVIVGQFRRITQFMQKHASNNNDPRVKTLLKMLNMQFNKIDEEMKVDTTKLAEEN